MAFQFFDGSHTTTSAPRITLRRGGLIALNPAAVKLLGDGTTHVQVGYDDEKGAIGVRPAGPDAVGKYVLRKPPKGDSRIVNGKRLLEHHGIQADAAKGYEVQDFGEGIIGFYLNGEPKGAAEETSEATANVKRASARTTKKAA